MKIKLFTKRKQKREKKSQAI
jgi:hypothetical protein